MYYPYLRGKQYELLALPALCDSSWAQGVPAVWPIIEPVREQVGGLVRAATALFETGIGYTVVLNPTVGDVVGNQLHLDLLQALEAPAEEMLLEGPTPHYGVIVDKHHDLNALIELQRQVQDQTTKQYPCTVLLRGLPSQAADIHQVIETLRPHTVVFDTEREARHVEGVKRADRTIQRVRMDDPFQKKERNSDYPDQQPMRFSEEHRYYHEDGWAGFGDYLTIGRGFTDSGFTPRAVAIHWTYVDDSGDNVMIQHYVSDRQEGLADVPGKFHEALAKLIESSKTFKNPINKTAGLQEMRGLFDEGHYPGLGSIKKLSMMNHMEIMSTLARNS